MTRYSHCPAPMPEGNVWEVQSYADPDGDWVKVVDLPKWKRIDDEVFSGKPMLLRCFTGECRIGWAHPNHEKTEGIFALSKDGERIVRRESVTHYCPLDDLMRLMPVEG